MTDTRHQPAQATRGEAIQIGPYRVRSVVTHLLRLAVRQATEEGGTFRRLPGAVDVVTRVLVLEGPQGGILIDSGDADTERGALAPALARSGIDPESVRTVILTHLHHDHAGGIAGAAGPLARAEILVAREHLAHAGERASRGDAEGFRAGDLERLRGRRVRCVGDRDGEEILPSVRSWRSDGHTRAMLGLTIEGPEGTLLVPSDLLPTIAHLRLQGSGEYDLDRPRLAAERRRAVAAAIESDGLVFLYHDPRHVALRLSGTPERPIAREEVRF